MSIVGVKFGPGLDTASIIALVPIAGGAGIVMPWYAAVAFLVRIVGLCGVPVSTYSNSGLLRELHFDDRDDYCVPGRDWTDRARAANSPRDRAPAFARRLET